MGFPGRSPLRQRSHTVFSAAGPARASAARVFIAFTEWLAGLEAEVAPEAIPSYAALNRIQHTKDLLTSIEAEGIEGALSGWR